MIEMYFADHPPPHFHARYGGEEATVVIATGEVLGGSLPERALRLVREWLEQHRGRTGRELGAGTHTPAGRAGRAAEMTELIKVRAVKPLAGHWLQLEFSDGAVKEVDLGEVLAQGGVFAPIHDDRAVFEQVRVNPESLTIEWPGEIDLDPEVLYGRHEPASGAHISRRIVREPAHA